MNILKEYCERIMALNPNVSMDGKLVSCENP
jgi:hypothetical protein